MTGVPISYFPSLVNAALKGARNVNEVAVDLGSFSEDQLRSTLSAYNMLALEE